MEVDKEYFSAYEDFKVHELMLRDSPRNKAYFDAITKNKLLFEGKIVMDVGAGTGILSVMCAKAGARLVLAVEASDMHQVAQETVKENKVENVVKVIHSRIEDLKIPDNILSEINSSDGCHIVDVIVSEWMGFYLLHEGMLDSVLYARDHFLKNDGFLFPCEASIFVAPCSWPDEPEDPYWNNVCGVSLRTFGKACRSKVKTTAPDVKVVEEHQLLHKGECLYWIDLKDRDVNLETIRRKCVLAVNKDGNYKGVCIWFDCTFPSTNDEPPVVLSTSPNAATTHWKQTVIALPNELEVQGNEPIAFEVMLQRNQSNPRRYDIVLSLLDPEEVEHPEPCDCYMTRCILTKAHLARLERGELMEET